MLHAAEWWRAAREQWSADLPAREWRDVVAYLDLDHEDRSRIGRRIKAGLADADTSVRKFAQLLATDVVVATMDAAPTSEHLRLELTAAHWRGRRTGRPVPLEPGEPVPGCSCERCTGRPAPLTAAGTQRTGDYSDPLPVEDARRLPITAVAARLGLAPNRSGYAQCPFHDDSRPSLHLNDRKAAAFCNPCGKSWDGIALTMELRGLDFPAAVRWLLRPEAASRTVRHALRRRAARAAHHDRPDSLGRDMAACAQG